MKQILKYTYALGLVLTLTLPFAAISGAFPFVNTAGMNLDGYVSVLVTTPADNGEEILEGATPPTHLFSVSMKSGELTKDDELKKPSPFNLGVLTQSELDGAPLNIILLGDRLTPGFVHRGFGIGVLRFTKGGKSQQIVLAVPKGGFAGVYNIETLKAKVPGTLEKLQAWLGSDWGASGISIEGSRMAAINLLGDCLQNYAYARITEADKRPMDKDGNPTLLEFPTSKNLRNFRE